MTRVRFAAAVLATAVAIAVGLPAHAGATPSPAGAAFGEPCSSGASDAVTVVVDFAALGGGVLVSCATGLTAASRGSAALSAAGISFASPVSQPGFVCRIAGRPAADESVGSAGYREECVNTPPAFAYWSYWKSSGDGAWQYSDAGFTSGRVLIGGFEGWSFSTGAQNPPAYQPVTAAAPPPPEPEPEPEPADPAPVPAPADDELTAAPQPAPAPRRRSHRRRHRPTTPEQSRPDNLTPRPRQQPPPSPAASRPRRLGPRHHRRRPPRAPRQRLQRRRFRAPGATPIRLPRLRLPWLATRSLHRGAAGGGQPWRSSWS